MEDNNNKQKKLTIIAVVTLIALVAGATYAYFSVGTTSNFGTSTINATADNIGTVTLNGSSANLNLHVTALDMAQGENSINYYATPDGTSTDESEKETVLGTASVLPTTDTNYYHCTYTIQVSHSYSGDKNMYNIFKGTQQVNNETYIASDNELVLLVNGTSYDLNTNTLPKEIDGEFYIQGDQTVDVTAGLKLVNLSNKNQNMLAGSGVNISIQVKQDSFTCTAEEKPHLTGLTLIASHPDNLTTTLVGGLYRYQGTTVNNNYICFGTTNMETCKTNADAYMYRIIGIKESGQMKLIKHKSFRHSMPWAPGDSTDYSWIQSTIYQNYNNWASNPPSWLPTFIPANWIDKVTDTIWKYGDSTLLNDYNGDNAYSIENAWSNTTVPSKIGLMYVHDYYYAYPGGNPETYTNAKTAWIHISNCGQPNVAEWTMSRFGSHQNGRYSAWALYETGEITTSSISTDYYATRPVFYLTSDIEIEDGNGTIDSPYMIKE